MAQNDLYQDDPNDPTKKKAPAAQTNLGMPGGPYAATTDPMSPSAPTAQTNAAPTPAPAPAGVPIGAEDWAKLGITPAQATPGMAIPGQPGKTLFHNGYAWEIRDATPAAPAAAGPTAAPTAAPVAPTAPAAPITTIDQATATTVPAGQTTTPGVPTSIAQSFQQALVNKLNPQPASVESPSITPAIQANRLAEQRGRELQANQLAEQAARSGTNMSGGTDALQRGILADSAMREGQYAGGLVQHLQDQQDADLMAALGLGGQTLQTNAARGQQESQFARSLAEQKRAADLQAELQRLGITTQGSLGGQDIALRGRLGDQQANLGLLGLLLSNDQFGRQLTQQGNQFGASLDQSGLLSLLGLL